MTQFILCKPIDSITLSSRLLTVPVSESVFLSKVASSFFNEAQKDQLFTVLLDRHQFDTLCTSAQKDLADGASFVSTDLFRCLQLLLESCSELIFWYGDDFEDLELVSYQDVLFNRIAEQLNDSHGEMYIHYRVS